jgi:putative addiction module killer protein
VADRIGGGLRLQAAPLHPNPAITIDKSRLVAYTLHMPTVTRTDEFSNWLQSLQDIRARAKILARIDRLELGNPGDIASVGEGISELRIHYGPGYRIYIYQQGEEIVILLCGGDKSSQRADIALAKELAVRFR